MVTDAASSDALGAVAFLSGRAAGVQQSFRVGVLSLSGFEPPRMVSSFPGGFPMAMEWNRLYCMTERGFTVMNLTDPTRPVVAGSWPNDARHIGVANGLAYLYRWGTLEVLDVGGTPKSLVRWDVPVSASAFELDGSLLSLDGSRLALGGTLQSGGGWVELVDVANPGRPVSLGGLRYPERSEVLAVGLESGLLAVLRFEYNVALNHSLELHDVTNPAAPRRLASFPLSSGMRGVHLCRGRAYVISEDEGLTIVDTRPTEGPRIEARYPGLRGTRVRVGASEAVIASGTGVRVIRALPGLAPVLRLVSDAPGKTLTVEHAPSLSSQATWSTLVVTNPPIPGVLIRDTSTEPRAFEQRYYRVR